MPRRPKINTTTADVVRHREMCPRESCDGFLCTVSSGLHYRKVCNDCGRIEGYYKGDRRVSREEYERAARHAEERRRRSGRRPKSSTSWRLEEGEGSTMAKQKVKGKAKKVAKGAKKVKKGKKVKRVGLCALIRELAVAKPNLNKTEIGDLVEKKLGMRPADGTLQRQVFEARRDAGITKKTKKAKAKKAKAKKK